jgi:hypothetical protein
MPLAGKWQATFASWTVALVQGLEMRFNSPDRRKKADAVFPDKDSCNSGGFLELADAHFRRGLRNAKINS